VTAGITRALNRIRSSRDETRVGRWWIRRSIRQLARRARKSSQAATDLTRAIEENGFAQLLGYSRLLSLIRRYGDHPPVRDGVAAAWAQTRSPLLAGILRYTGLRPTPSNEYSALVLTRFDAAAPPTRADSANRVLDLSSDPDPVIARAAIASLGRVETDEAWSAVASRWAETRDDRLRRVIEAVGLVPAGPQRARVFIQLLLRDPSLIEAGPEVLPVVEEALNDLELRAFAEEAVRSFRAVEMLEALSQRWVEGRSSLYRDVLVAARHVPAGPPRVQVLVRLLIGDKSLRKAPPGLLPHLEEVVKDPDVGSAANEVLRCLELPETRATLCVRALQGDEVARVLCIEAGYVPEGDHERAIFLFLTEQWDRYYAVDFDGSLLGTAYELVDEPTRLRLRQLSARSGRAVAMRVILGGDRSSRIRALQRQEAEFLIEQLATGRDYEGLWRLVFELPLAWGVGALRVLASADWRPHHQYEQALFTLLRDSIPGDLTSALAALANELPPAAKRADVRFNGRIASLGFSPDGHVLAIASGQRSVGLWDLKQGRMSRRYQDFHSSLGNIVVLPDETVLVSERAQMSTTTCLVRARNGDRWSPISTHIGSITGMIAHGHDSFATCGRDRWVRITRSDGQTLAKTLVADWPRAMKAFGDGRRAVAVHSGLSVVDLSAGVELVHARPFNRIPVDLAMGPGTDEVITGYRSGKVISTPLSTLTATRPSYVSHGGAPVRKIEAVPQRNLVLVGRAVQVDVLSWPSRERVGFLPVDGVASLTVAPSGDFLAIGHAEDRASLWDLRVSTVPTLFSQPLIDTTPSHLAILEALAGTRLSRGSMSLIAVLRAILQYRFRHDVELDELIEIKAGRYDIAID